MTAEREKNERVLHARIPESLDQELKDKAARLGVSVSNLVRNILNNAVDLVEDVILDSSAIARSARGEAEARAAAPATVLGWQRLILEQNALCATCNGILARGTEAAMGVLDGPGTRPFRCLTCLEEVRRDDG